MPTHASRLGVGDREALMPRTKGGLGSRLAWVVRVLAISLVLAGLPLQPGLAAPSAQDAVFVVTSPGSGAALSGEVTIQGTATHPNFASYGILYAPGSKVTGTTLWDTGPAPTGWLPALAMSPFLPPC